jgi:hypothetical protein
MKKIALLAPTSSTDVWNIPISFYKHLVKSGHDVKFYNTLVNDKFDATNFLQLISDYQKRKFVPDIILHLDFGFFNHELLKKSTIPEAKWVVESGDDPQNFHLNFNKINKCNFDLILTPDIRAVNQYLSHTIPAVWCPYFADPEQFVDVEQDPIVDAVTTRDVAEPFFKDLKTILQDRFIPRDNNFLVSKEHTRHLKKGFIVVQNSKYKEITRRIFEAMMAKRMVLTDRLDPSTQINQIFTENKDIVYFDSLEDCVNKINFYTNNPNIRDEIALNGFNKVNKFHTTPKRIQKILTLLDQ